MNGSAVRRLTAALVLGACLAFVLWRALVERWITDDALITFRYVENAAHGRGLVFNAGEHVEAFSSLVFVVLLVPFSLAGANLFEVAIGLGITATLVEVAIVFGLLARRTTSLLVAAAGAALFASDRMVAVWASGGLETALDGALLTLAFALATSPTRRPVAATIAFLALAACRPEGVAFYPLYVAYLARVERAAVIRSLNVFVPVLGGLLLLRFLYYGQLLPNPFHAKMDGVPTFDMGMLYVHGFARRIGLTGLHALVWVALVVAAVVAWRRATPTAATCRRLAVAAGIGVAWGVTLVAIMGGDYMNDFRLLRPVVGMLYIGVAALLGSIWFADTLRWRAIAAALALAFAISHGIRQHDGSALADAGPAAIHKQAVTVTESRSAEFRRALLAFAEPGDALLVDWAGVMGYGHTLRTVDCTGLVSPHIGGDFYLRPVWGESGRRERLPGHARWPTVAFMEREHFAFIFPKVNQKPPTEPEIHPGAPSRTRNYPFLHVTIPLPQGRFLRFFTTLTPDEIIARAHAHHLTVCWRPPWGDLTCSSP